MRHTWIPWFGCLVLSLAAAGQTVYVEAEDLPYQGDWQVNSESGTFGEGTLVCREERSQHPAVGLVRLPAAGRYALRVRARDFPADRPGIRRFAIELNGQRSAVEFGAHGRADADGWDWEHGGEFDLPAGEVLVALVALTAYARCDAFALVPAGGRWPSSPAQAREMRAELPEFEGDGVARPGVLPALAVTDRVLAELANAQVRVRFLAAEAGSAPAVAVAIDRQVEGRWVEVMRPSPEVYWVVAAPPETTVEGFSGSGSAIWPERRRELVTVNHGGTTYHTAIANPRWITLAGELVGCQPASLTPPPAPGGPVRLQATGEVGTVEATWSLLADSPWPKVDLRLTAARAGSFGLGYGAGPGWQAAEVAEIMCPFLHQYRRIPRTPELTVLEYCASPLAAAEVAGAAGPATIGIALDPSEVPTTWPDVRQLTAGFQLAGIDGVCRPTAWPRIPGGQGSVLATGGSLTAGLRVLAEVGDWYQAYARVATGLFGLRDYRRNHDLSLTETALNVIRLLHDADASGWSEEGLGWWNIESTNAVTQAAPLAVLSAAYLTGDEQLLASRAVPSLAHILSRRGPHFPTALGEGAARLGDPTMGEPMRLYGGGVRLAAAAMCRGYTPRFGQVAFEDAGALVPTRGYSKAERWEDALSAWRATGDEAFLAQVRSGAAEYAATWAAKQDFDIDRSRFFQLSYSGNWEGLLHAAEVTGDPAIEAAAVAIARRMVAGLKTFPMVGEGSLTVHPEGQFQGNGIWWWKGPDWFILGATEPAPDATGQPRRFGPMPAVPETVEAWVPSPVGLGIEQPTTYRRPTTPCAPIMMNNWAAGLLRLAAAADDPLLRTAAHNGMLGRWGNYPGYYLVGYTSLPTKPDYPYTGPDVSSLYFHHIPPFLAAVLDYLVTDVEVRSGGAITFPCQRQQGYAWFDNRVYGHAPGRVYDAEGVWPWLAEGLVRCDTPLVNWLAGHTDDTVYVMLTNTASEALRVAVELDEARCGGPVAAASYRQDNGPAQPVAPVDGRLTVPVSGQGLTVIEVRGCRPRVALHTSEAAALHQPDRGYASTDSGTSGRVHAQWIGVGPEHNWLHVYTTVTTAAEGYRFRLTQGDQTKEFVDTVWPFEVILPVAQAPVTVDAEALLPDRETAEARPMLVLPPGP